jgi:hypothetical protein
MSIQCPAEVSVCMPSGEMVDQETGQLRKWGERSQLHVKFPNEKFHSLVYVPGHFPVGKPGVAVYDFGVKLNKPVLLFKSFTPDAEPINMASPDPFKK